MPCGRLQLCETLAVPPLMKFMALTEVLTWKYRTADGMDMDMVIWCGPEMCMYICEEACVCMICLDS